jgi:hypothetical protein
VASLVYNSAKVKFAQGVFNWAGQTFKIMLVNGYTPNVGSHSSRADVTNEVTGTGYTAGGQALASCSVTQDNTNNRAVLGANNPAWPAATITATGAVVYQANGGGASGDPLVCYLDFGGTVASTANTFTVAFGAAGVVTNS